MNEEQIGESVSIDEMEDLDAQLFAILTTRWLGGNSSLNVGVPQSKLLEALGCDDDGLDKILEAFTEKIRKFGLELVEYYSDNDKWYCIKTVYACPNELSTTEQAVLGVIISLIEANKMENEKEETNVEALRNKLVRKKYLSEYRLTKVIKYLEKTGFVRRSTSRIKYGPRTKIELDNDRRLEIAEKAKSLII